MRDIFPSLIGNNETKARLYSLVMKNTLPHAFLIVGSEGSGKKTLTRELAALLNCENRDNESKSAPCCECNNCRRIREGLFTDVHYVRRDSKKMSIGVGEIHKMREDMILSATESDYRIYVIEEAEKLTPQAQNAMLTVLEEPPSKVVIILLASEADKILTTVKSRAQAISMQRFSRDELTRYLCERSETARALSRTAPEKLSGLVMAADGRIGRALELLDDGKASGQLSERRAATSEFINALRQNAPYSELYAATKELPTGRAEFQESLEEILLALRDLTLLKYDRNAPLLFYTSADEARRASEKINVKRLFALSVLINDTLKSNAQNANIAAAIANLAAQIKLI